MNAASWGLTPPPDLSKEHLAALSKPARLRHKLAVRNYQTKVAANERLLAEWAAYCSGSTERRQP